jgi:site-specific recombinase XerD
MSAGPFSPSVNDLLRGFTDLYQASGTYSPRTVQLYTRDVSAFVRWLDGNRLIGREGPSSWFHAKHISAFMAWLEGRRISSNTRCRMFSSLRAFGQYLRGERLISRDPTRGLQPPAAETFLPKGLPRPSLKHLAGFAPSLEPLWIRDRAIVALILGTGSHVDELAHLDLKDLQVGERWVLLGRGWPRERRVAFGASWVEPLTEYIAVRDQLRPRFRASDALFLNRRGGRLTRRSMHRSVEKFLRAAGLRGNPRTLRQTYGIDLLRRTAIRWGL